MNRFDPLHGAGADASLIRKCPALSTTAQARPREKIVTFRKRACGALHRMAPTRFRSPFRD
jgi:hypothetical protein